MTTIATECNVCPKGIVRCTHMDGRVVWLVDGYLFPSHDGWPGWNGTRWGVQGPDIPEKCICGADHCVMEFVFGTDSLADAEAEFRRRERLLREG